MADDQNNQTIEQPPAQEPAPAAESAAPEAPDELATIRQELEAARTREAEYLDGWQRARAELSNARKRFQREQELAYSQASGEVLVRLLPIVDDFERALASQAADLAGHGWAQGMALIYHKLQLLLEAEGVSAMDVVGRPFDPLAHQAVTHEPSDTVPEGHIIDQVQKGYSQQGRVLRPAVVRVSSGPAQDAPQTD